MMTTVQSAIAGGVLAAAVSCGGDRARAPAVTLTPAASRGANAASSATQTASALEVTKTASVAETSEPWSAGMAETAPNRFLETKGVRFAYRAFGRKPGVPVVFLAPLGRNMDFRDPKLTDALARGHLVLLFDNAGVGLSSGESPSSVAETAKSAAAFIDALKELSLTDSDWMNGRIDVLGFSFGGFVAQQLALDRPDLVERVVLAGTGPQGAEGVKTGSSEAEEGETEIRAAEDDLLGLFFAQSETSRAAGRAFIARIANRQADRDAPVASKTIAAQSRATKVWGDASKSRYSHLAGLRQPVLVADGAFAAKNSVVLAHALPNAELVVYPDSARGFLFQYPERFAERVSTFLRRP